MVFTAAPSFKGKSDRPHNIDALEGSSVTFVCSPDAIPEASIDWFYNGQLIDGKSHNVGKYTKVSIWE